MGMFGDVGGSFGDILEGVVGMGGTILGMNEMGQGGAGYSIDPNAYLSQYSEADRAALQQALLAQQNKSFESDQIRQQQMALAQALQGQISGSKPSVAEQQMQRGGERNILQNQALLASNRGVNAGLAARLAGQSTAQSQQQNVSDTSLLRAQEQGVAQNTLGNLLAGARQQDLSSTGLQQDMMKYYQQNLLNQAEQNRQAQMEQQKLQVALATGNAETIGKARAADLQSRMGVLGVMGQVGAAYAGAS